MEQDNLVTLESLQQVIQQLFTLTPSEAQSACSLALELAQMIEKTLHGWVMTQHDGSMPHLAAAFMASYVLKNRMEQVVNTVLSEQDTTWTSSEDH